MTLPLIFCPRIKVLAIRAYSEYTAQMLKNLYFKRRRRQSSTSRSLQFLANCLAKVVK